MACQCATFYMRCVIRLQLISGHAQQPALHRELKFSRGMHSVQQCLQAAC